MSPPNATLPVWHPQLSLQEMTGVVYNWYRNGLIPYYHLQHMMLRELDQPHRPDRMMLRELDQPPRPKRRKTCELSDSNNLLRNRGHVTFKPYSDDLESGCGCGADNERRFLFLQLQPNQKKKRVTSLENGGSGSGLEESGSVNQRKRLRTGEVRERMMEKTAAKTTVENLFPEILAIIFQYLDVQSKGRASRVCRKWRDAGYRKSVWFGVKARLHIGRNNSFLYPSLVRRGIKQVQVLSLRKSLRELINGIPNLESLNLSGCYNLSDSALDLAFNKDVSALKQLNLSLCKDVSDNSLGRIATHCKNLEELDLGGCTKITNMGLFFISLGLKKIQRLNLRSCRQVSDLGIAHLAGLNNPSIHGSKSIVDLGLQDCQKLSDESLRHIATGLPHIEKINLSFCVSITDTGLKSLSRMSSLRDLNLRSCDNVSDLGLGYLSEEGGSLRQLDVSFCANVSDSGLRHVSAGMPGLRSLHMTTCAISDDGLKRAGEKLKELTELHIGQCLAVTDKGLLLLADGLHKLQMLDLYGCPKVTAQALAKIRQMPQMKKLNLTL